MTKSWSPNSALTSEHELKATFKDVDIRGSSQIVGVLPFYVMFMVGGATMGGLLYFMLEQSEQLNLMGLGMVGFCGLISLLGGFSTFMAMVWPNRLRVERKADGLRCHVQYVVGIYHEEAEISLRLYNDGQRVADLRERVENLTPGKALTFDLALPSFEADAFALVVIPVANNPFLGEVPWASRSLGFDAVPVPGGSNE